MKVLEKTNYADEAKQSHAYEFKKLAAAELALHHSIKLLFVLRNHFFVFC